MRLSPADVPSLPAAAALFDSKGGLIAGAHTPEWTGIGPGSTSYRLGVGRLVVATQDVNTTAAPIVDLLLESIRGAKPHLHPDDAAMAEMYAIGFEVTTGRQIPAHEGTLDDVWRLALIGSRRRTEQKVEITRTGTWGDRTVVAPEAIALALVQLVVNAYKHGNTARIAIDSSHGPTFKVSWADPNATGRPEGRKIATSRRRELRDRWGMAYCLQVADALGGSVSDVLTPEPGLRRMVLSFGTVRLALPLAVIRDHQIESATSTWTAETETSAGDRTQGHLELLCAAAEAAPGTIITNAKHFAGRAMRGRVYAMLPPEDDPTANGLTELRHERDLWSKPEPADTQMKALIMILRRIVANEEFISADEVDFAPQFHRACAALGIATPSIDFDDRLQDYPDPVLAAYLLSRVGDELTVAGRLPVLRIRAGAEHDPVVQALAPDATGYIPLVD